jgi:hypothetical protein
LAASLLWVHGMRLGCLAMGCVPFLCLRSVGCLLLAALLRRTRQPAEVRGRPLRAWRCPARTAWGCSGRRAIAAGGGERWRRNGDDCCDVDGKTGAWRTGEYRRRVQERRELPERGAWCMHVQCWCCAGARFLLSACWVGEGSLLRHSGSQLR